MKTTSIELKAMLAKQDAYIKGIEQQHEQDALSDRYYDGGCYVNHHRNEVDYYWELKAELVRVLRAEREQLEAQHAWVIKRALPEPIEDMPPTDLDELL